MSQNLLSLHTLSPLHPGTGQGVGVIDLPIAREKATGIPFLPGSSIKGVLRDACERVDANTARLIFGAENLENAGCVQFGDAKLLLLPVRSLKGTFAYVTSPYLLERLRLDAEQVGRGNLPPKATMQPSECWVYSQSLVVDGLNRVILEDLDFAPVVQANDANSWAEAIKGLVGFEVASRLCIVHDDAMSFLMETATEVVARNVLSEQKTAQNLWYEESLPAESVLVGLMLISRPRANGQQHDEAWVLDQIKNLTQVPPNPANGAQQNQANPTPQNVQPKLRALQFGGKASVGRGLAQVKLV